MFCEARSNSNVLCWGIALLAIFLLASSTNLAGPVFPLATITQQNKKIEAAQQAFAEGQQLLQERTADSQRKAIEKFVVAAALWRAVDDKRRQAIALSFIGKAHDLLGEKHQALDFYTQTLTLTQAVGDRSSEAATLNNIGLIYDSLGEKQKALNYYDSALPILQETHNTRVEAITLVNIGLVNDSIGEKQKALQFYRRALPLLRAAHDRGSEAVTLNNIAYLYDSIGEQQSALAYFDQALLILHEIGDRRVEAITLNNIGYVYDALDEKQKALDYYNRALPILRVVGDRRMQAVTLNNIGLVQKAIGDKGKALDLFNQALELRRAVGDRSGEGVTLSDIGAVYALLGEEQKALEFYQQALQLSRAVEDRSTEASTLRRIAVVKRNQGDLAEARTNIEEALDIVEHLRKKVAGQELRASYFASVYQFFETYIDVLMRLHHLNRAGGYNAMALQAAERARARTLLDSLAEARANIREGVAPELLSRERTLRQKLDATAERQARLLGGDHPDEQAAALKKEIETLLIQYQEIETEIRVTSPHYAALMQPLPSSLKEIQQHVLDSDTLLLEYALGEERSYLWAVTSGSIKAFDLPARAEIEAATRRAYESLTARNKIIKFEKPAEQSARIAKADADFASESSALSQMLLGPVASQLENKRLLIVSDGALNYLPFAALPAPLNTEAGDVMPDSRPQTRGSRLPLIAAHEIVSLPSASTLSILRSELNGRMPVAKTLAVVADPVFERDDQRVKGIKPRQRSNAIPKRSIEVQTVLAQTESVRSISQSDSSEGTQIRRLPFTRREAEQILALVSEGDRFRALDFDASRSTATNPVLGQYRYVHFATHGFLDAAHPELSAIVLSLVNRQGAEQDGFLWAHEVYNLHLPVEMVVLSGCRTGLGKEIKGEGLVGLTRGFMYAGSARVVVSLWDIDDEASAALMTDLYKAILNQHLTPAAALRAAQIKILNDKRWQAPYYWAAFVLQGEPK